MRKIKLLFIGLTFLLSLTSCTSDYYYDDYYHDIPTPEIMIGKWVNQDYTSPYKEIYLYRNGTYNVRYHSSILSTTFTGRWYYRDRYLYFAGEILDLHGEIGGYNLMVAWFTGMIVADAIKEKYGIE